MTEHYDNIRTKESSLDNNDAYYNEMKTFPPNVFARFHMYRNRTTVQKDMDNKTSPRWSS